MMSIRAFGDDTLYVSFPLGLQYESIVPPEVDAWLIEHNIDDWGSINQAKVGVFLSGEDAVAFRLKFSL